CARPILPGRPGPEGEAAVPGGQAPVVGVVLDEGRHPGEGAAGARVPGREVEVRLDGVEAGVGGADPGRGVAGGLGRAHLAPADRLGEGDRVVVAECVVPEDVHAGARLVRSLVPCLAPVLGSRHRRLRPARVDDGPAIIAYRRVTREGPGPAIRT